LPVDTISEDHAGKSRDAAGGKSQGCKPQPIVIHTEIVVKERAKKVTIG
jgi:hypothetical protein